VPTQFVFSKEEYAEILQAKIAGEWKRSDQEPNKKAEVRIFCKDF